MTIIDVTGWLGALILLTAYAASTNRPTRRPTGVHLGNLLGSLGLGAVAAAHRAWPSVAVNAVWLVIAGAALARDVLRQYAPHPAASGRPTRPRRTPMRSSRRACRPRTAVPRRAEAPPSVPTSPVTLFGDCGSNGSL